MQVKTPHQFKRLDSTSTSSALKELQLHFWYLTKDMVPFCLFDSYVANEEKDKIAETLLLGKGHHAAVPQKRKGNGKPKFPEEVNMKSHHWLT